MPDSFSPEQSLQLIQSMIEKTKSNISQNRFYFLFWGWLVFSTVLAQFILKVVFQYTHHYLVHLMVIPAVVITIYYAKTHHKRTHRTYIGESMSYLWTGIGISFFILSFLISNLQEGFLNGYPFFILFYGLGTFVSGRILQFKPLVIGGIVNWILACLCIFVSFDYQMLIAALAILTSYIIPGHLIRPNQKTQHG
jgi:hypothetical protein